MDFTRDEGQEAVAEVVVEVLEREPARDLTLWPRLVDSGLLSMPVPECHGGDGMGSAEVAVLLEELAAAAVAVPILPTLGFALPWLVANLPDDLAGRVLPAVGQGTVVTVALSEPGAPFTTAPATTATLTDGAVVITGHKVMVPFAEQARWLLIPTDVGVALVETGTPGLTCTATRSSAEMPEASVRLDGVRVPAEQLLPGTLEDLHRHAVAAIGAVADGLLRGAVALTAEHLRTRHQFGRPLAEFQAVAQEIADVYVVSRTLHVAAVSAAWALAQPDADPERVADDLDVLAYTVAAELPAAMQRCHHLHGGIGVDVTHAMHRYYSQAKDLARWLGGPSLRLDRLGAACSSI